jgi:hypothetical protein
VFQLRFVPFASSWLCVGAVAACGSDVNVLVITQVRGSPAIAELRVYESAYP